MTVNKLKSHILKEMQLSFRLTEQREMASGQKKPGKRVLQPVASKEKAASAFPTAPAEISKIQKRKMDVESPQNSKAENKKLESFQKPKKAKSKFAVQKRPVPYEDTTTETSSSKKKPKRELVSPVDNVKPKSDGTNGKGLAKQGKSQEKIKKKEEDLLVNKKPEHSGKPTDSGLRISKKPAIKVSKNNKKTHAEVKLQKLNNSKRPKVKVAAEKLKKVNGSKAKYLPVPKINGIVENSLEDFEDNSNFQEHFEAEAEEEYNQDFECHSEDEQSTGSETFKVTNGYLRNAKLITLPNNYQAREKLYPAKGTLTTLPPAGSETFNVINGYLRNAKLITLPNNYQAREMLFPAIKKPKKTNLHIFEGDCQASVRQIKVFGSLAEMDSDDTDDEYLPRNSEDLESEDFDSEDTDTEDVDSEDLESGDIDVFDAEDSDDSESDDIEDSESNDNEDSESDDSDESETYDFGSSIFDSDDSTYEPPSIDGFFDDTPPHLQKEPLIIEEIFDESPVAQIKNALGYESMENEMGKKEIAGETIMAEKEQGEEAEVTESHTDTSITEPIHVSQPNDAPFYRNPQSTPTELSVFENSLKSNYVIAVIKENIELYGTLVLTLLSGQIVVNGHRARRQEPLTIYSLKGLPWVSVSPTKTKKPVKDQVNWKELNENFTRAQLDRIQGSFQSHTDAIVLLQRNAGAQRLLETFGKHMAQNVFPLLNNSNRPYHQSESLLQCLIQNSDLSRTLIVPQVWNKLKVQAASRIMIAGGKGVGKSSLLRYLINRNLGQLPSFLLIDLDIGQPEIFVPQTVSCTLIDGPLLGPGFLLNKQPDYAFVVGHTNIVMCAEQYARAVIHLVQNIQNDRKYANIPWLINTMGYNKGFGTELMALLVDRIRPTDLVQIASPMAINNFDFPLEWSSLLKCKPIIYTADEFRRVNEIPKYTLHKLMSAVPPKERGTWSLSAKDMRYSNLLARLSSCLTGNAKSLADCQPLRVPLNAVQVQHPISEDYTRDELIQGMEANVVYLCHKEANGLPLCLGIGVVRAIDYERQNLFLVPAMPLQRMSLVNTLILAGELTLPQGYFRDQGQEVSTSVPFVFILDDSKSSKSIQQIYHRAPAFLGVPASQRNGD